MFLLFVVTEAWNYKLNAVWSVSARVNQMPFLTLFFISLNLFKIIANLVKKWKYGICSPFIHVHSTVTSRINFGRVTHTLQNMFAKNVIKIRLGKVLKWPICQYLTCVQSTVKLCAQVIKNCLSSPKNIFHAMVCEKCMISVCIVRSHSQNFACEL